MSAGYSTTTLLGVKEIQPKFTGLFMAMFFPQVATFATEEVAFDKIRRGVRLAPFVAPMVSGKARRERGGTTTTFTPAYVKPTDVVRPNRLLKRLPGEALNGSLSPAERHDAVVADILNEQEQEIVHREEWMASHGVLTGEVIVEGEQFERQVVDYGRSPENQITLLGAAKWDTVDPETYDPSTDIEDWAVNATGSTGVIIMDKLAWRLFSRFKLVKEKLDTRRGSTSQMELGPQLERQVMRKGFFGEYEIIVYTGQYEDTDGSKKNFMPDYTLLLAPSTTDNVMAYGGIQDAKANADGIVEATRYPSNWFTDNPSVEWLQTQSAPLPVIFDADAFVVITVAG